MSDSKHYNDYGTWIRSMFPFRVQKISINAGFSCPNRDGRIGQGGCIYCDNRTFNPSYCNSTSSIKAQLEEGKKFFSHKYPDMKFLAYFQAYTNTYESIDKLKHMYEEALSVEDVIGIVIGTRPDCVSDELLDYLGHLNTQTFITIEYGIETANNNTLKLINRGHDFECVKRIVTKTAEKGIITGGHIILGLPGEDSEEIIRQAPLISALPINILKLHQLQVIHGTKLEQMYKEHPFHLFSPDEYIELIGRYIKLLRKDIVIERFTSQSPKDMLVGPQWGMKNHEFTDKLMKYLRENNIYQGQNVILP